MRKDQATADRTLRSTLLLPAVVVLTMAIFALAACSSGDPVRAERSAPDPLPTAIPAPSGEGPNGEAMSLEVVDVGDVALITNGLGMAVYGNQNETIDEISCLDVECTSVWVPLQPRDAFISARLNAELYQVVARPDGIDQVAYDGTPLYTWAGDSLVGYPLGAGVAGIWFALTANGEQVR